MGMGIEHSPLRIAVHSQWQQAGPIQSLYSDLAQSQPPPTAERFLIIIFYTVDKAPKRGERGLERKQVKKRKSGTESVFARLLTSDLNASQHTAYSGSGSAFATTTEQRAFSLI